jgi:hypothetical protein
LKGEVARELGILREGVVRKYCVDLKRLVRGGQLIIMDGIQQLIMFQPLL